MCKKFLSLVLVLALSGIAAAANLNFIGDGDASSWGDSLNWNTAGDGTGTYQVPTSIDFARPSGNMVTVNTTGEVCDRLQMRGVANSGTTVLANMDLTTSGSVEMDCSTAGSSVTVTIDADGTMNACTQSVATSTATSFKLGRANRAGDSVCTVNGTLNVVSGAAEKSELAIGMWYVGGGGGGNWTLNVGSAGVVNADVLQVNTNPADGAAVVDITSGGVIILDGDQRNAIGGAVYGGIIFKGDHVAGDIVMDYGVTNAGKTTVQVPEPATIALLGLGGLLLRKRR